MDSETLQRPERLTVERWERLPWLLPRAVVIEWTGLDRRELDALVGDGRLGVFKTRTKRKYFKAQIATLVRIGTTSHPAPLSRMVAVDGRPPTERSTLGTVRGPDHLR